MMLTRRLYGRIDFSTRESEPHELITLAHKGRVLVDGKVINQAWFINTYAGIVKTYDVMGDNRPRLAANFTAADFPGREVDCPPDGILSETLRGSVELYGGHVD